jgi:hypothetical protein
MMIMMYDHDDGDVKGKQISPGNADTVLLYNHSMVSLSHTHSLPSIVITMMMYVVILAQSS